MKTILYNGKIRVSDGSFKEAVLIEDYPDTSFSKS